MTKKQRKADRYLLQIRNADREINDIILKIDYLRYKASGAGAIRYDKDRVQTSPSDMVCEAISEACDLADHLSKRHKELLGMRQHTEEVISLWNDNNSKCIDTYYLNRGSMVDVARICRCSARHAYRIKADALTEFSNHIQDIVD